MKFKDGSEIEVIGEFNANRETNKILQQVWVNGVGRTKNETVNSGQSLIIIIRLPN